jgi:tetratricopeptide (TPR) repeat protein
MTLRYTRPQHSSLDIALCTAYLLEIETTRGRSMNCRQARGLAAFAMGSLALGAGAHDGESLGRVDFPISCSAAQQQPFNRALSMLHSFWFPQAPKAFALIAEAEPDCAIAYWGMAISARANPLVGAPTVAATKSGWELLQKAKAAGIKTERERDYIAALDEYYRDWEKRDFPERVLAYEGAMDRLRARYPDDVEAAVLYALALNEGITVAPADKTYSRHLKAAQICEAVLAKQPDHPGALHFLIHSYDFPALASRGAAAAHHYANVAPSAPHALHMPSHIYSMLGNWGESIKSNQMAVDAAKGYVHAVDFMVYAHLQLGQDQAARRWLQYMVDLQKTAPAAQRTPTGALLSVYTAYAAIPARYAIERGAWSEASALEVHSTAPPADAITHFARAMGMARGSDVTGARGEIATLQSLREELVRLKDNYWAEQVEIQRQAALAWVAQAQGRKVAAVELMRAAADREDASEKSIAMENRLWPMRELLGELLLEQKQGMAALKEFEKSLATARNRLRGYYGMARAAEMSGKRREAAEYYAKLAELTEQSDSERKEIQQAKAFLAAR